MTEQLATPGEVWLMEQVAAGVNVPEDTGSCVSVMVPAGVTVVAGEVSVTVMTQLIGVFGAAREGVQTTVVEVDLCVAVSHI